MLGIIAINDAIINLFQSRACVDNVNVFICQYMRDIMRQIVGYACPVESSKGSSPWLEVALKAGILKVKLHQAYIVYEVN